MGEEETKQTEKASKVIVLQAVELKDLERLEAKVDKLVLLLTGNGKPAEGLVVRMDRIEQWRGSIHFLLVPVYVAIIGQIILFVFGIVTGHIQVGFR